MVLDFWLVCANRVMTPCVTCCHDKAVLGQLQAVDVFKVQLGERDKNLG